MKKCNSVKLIIQPDSLLTTANLTEEAQNVIDDAIIKDKISVVSLKK